MVLSSTPVSMRAVTRRLESMKLSDFEGENVKNAVSLIKGAMGLLDNNDALPSDIIDITFRIMKTSSTDEFNTHVNLMRSNHDLGVMWMTMSDLMLNLQKKYNELSLNGEWDLGSSSGQQSVFSCYSCAAEDHMWRQCPNLNEDQVQQHITNMQQSLQSGGSGRGGRGGRGGRRGMRTGRGTLGRGSNVFRAPPGSGQSHIRRRGPLVERWCGTCGIWGSHASAQHAQAESAHIVNISDQTQVSALSSVAPTASPTSTPHDDTTVVTTSTTDNASATPLDNASLPSLFLDFV